MAWPRRYGLASILFALVAAARAQEPVVAPDQGLIALEQALLDQTNDRTILCFAAHPDDEDGAALAYYRKRFGLRAVNLLATRGEGGQNEIGSQLYRDLGVLRTLESESAARLIGSEVYYLNFEDFGYSKDPDEAFENWGGKENVVRRLTETLRLARPDIVITNHGLLKDHGQHQACGQAILEAFDRAADPKAYSDGPRPFAISKLYVRRFEGVGQPGDALAEASINVGECDPLRGLCYSEIALAALRCHRSQGVWPSRDGWKGPQIQVYALMKARVKTARAEKELTEGLPWRVAPPPRALPEIEPSEIQEERQRGEFDVPRVTSDQLLRAYREETERLAKMRGGEPEGAEVIEGRREKIARTLTAQNGIFSQATEMDDVLVPGQRAGLRVQVLNGGARPIFVSSWAVNSGWIPALPVEPPGEPIGLVRPGERKEATLRVDIPNPPGLDRDPVTRPESIYWYAKDRVVPLFEVRARVNFGETLAERDAFLTPAVSVDPELRRAIEVEADPPDVPVILSRGVGAELIVRVRNNSPDDIGNARVRFKDPFTGKDQISEPLALPKDGGGATALGLWVHPPKNAKPGVYPARVEMEFGGGLPPGVDRPAPLAVRFHALEVKTAPGLRIGLVSTYDKSYEEALRALGVDYTLLDETALRRGNLGRYDAILLGLRAYFERPDVVEHNDRLLEYVKRGGNLIVSYNKTFEWNRPDRAGFAPYPLALGTDRVTREDAPVTILKPGHPHFRFPNAVAPEDFDGWVQERNLYLPAARDEHYEELLECHDPSEPARRSGHLMARYGRGTYVYTCYVWYRQLRALNPGAYKVFANMISITAVRLELE